MNIMRQILLLLSFLLSSSIYALVDYTETESVRPSGIKTPTAAAPAPQDIKKTTSRSTVSRASNMAHINFGAGFESLDFKSSDREAKVSLTHFHTHIQTNYDLFLSASFWQAGSNSSLLANNSSSQNGNPNLILGFNWLKFGKRHELATIDLYAGHSFKMDSDFASSRSDTITGVETSKRFYDFFLGLGYEYRLTGTPENPSENDLGPIQKLSASLGWRATPDIQFIVEASSVRIRPAKDSNHFSQLTDELSFTSITPKLGLGLRPYVQLELGARFQTQEANNQEELVNSRLWDMGDAYGNSIFAGLNISI